MARHQSVLMEQLQLAAFLYMKAENIKASRLSAMVFGNGSKLTKIMTNEAGITVLQFEAAMKWFADNWPKGVAWPKGAFRPKK